MSACHHFVLAVAFVAVSSLHADPEVRRAIPVERSKSRAPKPTPVRKALPAASPTPAAAADITPTPDSNASQFVSIPLLKDLTIEVPGSGWILGADLDAIIKTTAEATLKLANLPTSEGKRTTLFRANSMPQSTYASIAASVVNSPDMTLEEYNAAGESDLHELAQNIAASTEQAGITIISRPTAKKDTINGIPAIASSYARQGRKGVTRVETIFLFEAGKQFSITLAYRESEGDFWKPVIAHMRQSIARTASVPASMAAANMTPVPVTAAAPSSASADVVAHKDTTPQSAETSKVPPAPERLRWASHPAGMIKQDDILGVRLAEIPVYNDENEIGGPVKLSELTDQPPAAQPLRPFSSKSLELSLAPEEVESERKRIASERTATISPVDLSPEGPGRTGAEYQTPLSTGTDIGPLAAHTHAEGVTNLSLTAGQMDARSEGIPTDAEARQLMNSLRPGMSAHDIAKIDQRLQTYFEKKRNDRDFDNAERLSKIFDPKDTSGRRDYARQPNVKQVLDMYPDDTGKNMALDQIAVDAFFKAQAGRELNDAELEAHRHRFGQEMTGDPTTSISTAVRLIQKHFDRRAQIKEMSEELGSLALKDYIEGAALGKPPDSFKTLKSLESAHPELVNQRTQSQIFALYQEKMRQAQRTVERNRPAVLAFYNLASKQIKGEPVEQADIDAAMAAARAVRSTDRQRVFTAVADAVTVGIVDKAFVQETLSNIGKMIGRSID